MSLISIDTTVTLWEGIPWEYDRLTISICLKHSALEIGSKVMLSEVSRDMSYKTSFYVCFFKMLSLSFLIVCCHHWHPIVYCLNLASVLLPQQTFSFGCFTKLFLFGWKIGFKVCSGSIFSFCIFPPIQPSVQISNAEMLIRAFPPPWLTLLAFNEVSHKLWIKCSDHLCHLTQI